MTSSPPFGPFALSLALLLACYAPVLVLLATDWVRSDTARYGIPVVLFVIAVLWRDRFKLASLPRKPFRAGFALIIWGGAQAIAASLGSELFLGRTAFLIALAGLVLFHLGFQFAREVAVLWLLLWLTIPLPAILYNPIVALLQSIASAITESVLSLLNIPLHWEGTSMYFAGGVEQVRLIDGYGCLRLALAVVAASIAYGEWFRLSWKLRLALPAWALLLATGLSSLRIVVVAWLDEAGSTGTALRILEQLGPWVMATVTLALSVLAMAGIQRRIQQQRA